MYDPTIGQWLSEDPIGFEAADANLRRYVANSPTNATDPSGLKLVWEGDEEKVEAAKVLWELLKKTGNEAVKKLIDEIEKSDIVITIKIVRKSNDALVANFAKGWIDLADLEKFPEKDAPATIPSVFFHEVCEQWARYKSPPVIEDHPKSHKFACEAETLVSGYKRSPDSPPPTKNDDGTEDVLVVYEKDGKRYVVVIRTGQSPDEQNEIKEVILR